jgi:hypothetical protein
MPSDQTPEYCPFCGASLPEAPDPVRRHLDDHEDCAERYDGWAAVTGGRELAIDDGGNWRTGLSVLMWLVVAVVLAYSVLVARALFVGIIAAAAVVVAFQVAIYLGGR